MRFHKRLLFVLLALIGSGIGFVPATEAVTSPVIAMIVDCSRDTATSSAELDLDAPAGVYSVSAVGACNWAGARTWAITTDTCGTPPGSLPCATTTVANIPGDTCGTSVGFARVEACSPIGSTVIAPAPDCSFTIKVNNLTCLTTGTAQIVHGGGAFTAQFVDSGYFDNTGAFLVVFRPVV